MKIKKIVISLLLLAGGNNLYAADLVYRDFLRQNNANINRIEIGIDEARVIEIMGEDTSSVKDGAVGNPWRIERLHNNTIYHYLVKKHPPFTPLLENQAIPVLMQDGKVVGIGRHYLKNFRRKAQSVSNNNQTGKTLEERLKTLKELYDSKLITKEDYDNQKQKILDSI